jgi:hypothetical protein
MILRILLLEELAANVPNPSRKQSINGDQGPFNHETVSVVGTDTHQYRSTAPFSATDHVIRIPINALGPQSHTWRPYQGHVGAARPNRPDQPPKIPDHVQDRARRRELQLVVSPKRTSHLYGRPKIKKTSHLYGRPKINTSHLYGIDRK